MDGSTDKGRIENELFVILFCKKNDEIQEVKTCARYLCVQEPLKADSDGLIGCLSKALLCMGIEDIRARESVLGVQDHPVLVGCGTLSMCLIRMECGVSCVLLYLGCFGHGAMLIALSLHARMPFPVISSRILMLLRLYYLYEKSPKKCRELCDLMDDLKEVFEFPKEGGNLPTRAHGSRWISYKRKALQRFVDRYGAYLKHLSKLTEDKSIKSIDRQRLKGYLLKWRDARMLIGSALYTDALKPASLLSLTLQDDNVDVIHGIKHILKSHGSLKKLSSQNPEEWPVTKVVLSRMKDEHGGKVYQGSELHHFSDGIIKLQRSSTG